MTGGCNNMRGKNAQIMKLAILMFLCWGTRGYTQVACPANISFESGTFDNWQPYSGHILADGSVVVAPALDKVQLFSAKNAVTNDPYGNFPISSPDGSRFCVKVGDEIPDTKANRLVYSFMVPANSDNFSILFSYAVVIQSADHEEHQQPRFTVEVFNETRGEYIECSSFDFVAGFSQPDFFISEKDRNILYKPWSSAAINLGEYKGDKLRLEFTATDCSEGGHFGYAYFDIMEKCSNSVTGNIVCAGVDDVTLHAPENFASYRWYTGDFSDSLGDQNTYVANKPTIGDSFAVVLVPYSYLGCRDTFYTSITSFSDSIQLMVKDSAFACSNLGIDLTKPDLVSGSSAGLTFQYYADAAGTIPVKDPAHVQESGMYYIRATNAAGCTKTEPIKINTVAAPDFSAADPQPVKYPSTVSLIASVNNPALSYSFYEDETLTRPANDPANIRESGIYYIKGTNTAGCYTIEDVEVKISPLVSVPNSFTPNGDGKNDRFVYRSAGRFKEIIYFKIFNRLGQEIFSTTSLDAAWDGTYRGHPQANDTYVWMLKARDWLGEVYVGKGTIMLVR